MDYLCMYTLHVGTEEWLSCVSLMAVTIGMFAVDGVKAVLQHPQF